MSPSTKGQLRPVPFREVTFTDNFWQPRQEMNRTALIPHAYRMCNETGRIDAFRLNWKPGMPNEPHVFWDSDVAKWLEAASYSLAVHPDPGLERTVDEVVDLIAAAQQPDGYLNTHFTVVEPDKRWTNLDGAHELYCAGHLMEAAVAHFEATGKRTLLEVLCRYADHIGATFGTEPGKNLGYCGHPEVELALVRLYRATGIERYRELARYFVDERGRQPYYFDLEAKARGEAKRVGSAKRYEYMQAHKPVREQKEVVGHAVRALYLYSGMADIAALDGDKELLAACRRLWDDATLRKLYVTGGLGPSRNNEGFTSGYDLPNETAYAETCAAVALVFFAHRMLQVNPDRRYSDVIERALYNNVLSGASQDGRRFFYANPLSSAGPQSGAASGDLVNHGHTSSRVEWFGVSCCPPNLSRLVASLGQYVYSVTAKAVYVHLYAGGNSSPTVAGQEVRLTQATNYPWSGDVRIDVNPKQPAAFDLLLRIPGWCDKHTLKVNGRTVAATMAKGYARLRRTWERGDCVTLSLAMPVVRVAAHPDVAADFGKVALQRGPLIYCLEQCDNPDVHALVLPRRARLTARFDPRVLGGVTVIEGQASVVDRTGWKDRLYGSASGQKYKPIRIKAIPYFAWDNRKPGAMAVWLAQD